MIAAIAHSTSGGNACREPRFMINKTGKTFAIVNDKTKYRELWCYLCLLSSHDPILPILNEEYDRISTGNGTQRGYHTNILASNEIPRCSCHSAQEVVQIL